MRPSADPESYAFGSNWLEGKSMIHGEVVEDASHQRSRLERTTSCMGPLRDSHLTRVSGSLPDSMGLSSSTVEPLANVQTHGRTDLNHRWKPSRSSLRLSASSALS